MILDQKVRKLKMRKKLYIAETKRGGKRDKGRMRKEGFCGGEFRREGRGKRSQSKEKKLCFFKENRE